MQSARARLEPTRRPRLLRRLAVALAPIVAAVLFLVVMAFRDPTSHFLDRRSHLVEVARDHAEVMGDHVVESVRLRAASGLVVDLLIKRPLPETIAEKPAFLVRRPAVLLLGGYVTGRDAVRLIPESRG